MLVLGEAGIACDVVARVLSLHGLDAAVGDTTADGHVDLAVLVDPSTDDWEHARSLGVPLVLVTSLEVTADLVVRSLSEGADAVLPTSAGADELLAAVRTVARGGTQLTVEQARAAADALRRATHGGATAPLRLTPRQRDILVSIGCGHSVKQTARHLGVSPRTIENLQSGLFRKLGVRNRAQAFASAHAAGLLEPEGVAG